MPLSRFFLERPHISAGGGIVSFYGFSASYKPNTAEPRFSIMDHHVIGPIDQNKVDRIIIAVVPIEMVHIKTITQLGAQPTR